MQSCTAHFFWVGHHFTGLAPHNIFEHEHCTCTSPFPVIPAKESRLSACHHKGEPQFVFDISAADCAALTTLNRAKCPPSPPPPPISPFPTTGAAAGGPPPVGFGPPPIGFGPPPAALGPPPVVVIGPSPSPPPAPSLTATTVPSIMPSSSTSAPPPSPGVFVSVGATVPVPATGLPAVNVAAGRRRLAAILRQ